MNGFCWVCAATAMTAAVGMVSCQDRVSSVCGDYVDARAEQTARCSGFPLDDESKSSFSDLCVAAAASPGASGYVDGLEACADAIAKAGCGAGGDAC